MAKLNIEKILQKGWNIADSKYVISWDETRTIRDNSTGELDAICNGFLIGYVQGMKAAKAERRAKGRKQ